MKKFLVALLLVAVILTVPMLSFADVGDEMPAITGDAKPVYSIAIDARDETTPTGGWFYYKDAVTLKTDMPSPSTSKVADVADVSVPDTGVASFAAIASVLATLGCAIIPGKR